MSQAKVLLADRGYDANWFREALAELGIEACIPSKSKRKVQILHDKIRYRQDWTMIVKYPIYTGPTGTLYTTEKVVRDAFQRLAGLGD